MIFSGTNKVDQGQQSLLTALRTELSEVLLGLSRLEWHAFSWTHLLRHFHDRGGRWPCALRPKYLFDLFFFTKNTR